MSNAIPETFRFVFAPASSTGTAPPIISACSTLNFSFTTLTVPQSPAAPYTPVFYVQEPGKEPYSFAGAAIPSTESGTMKLPFNNSQIGTQFITCMFSANGQTGGCQNLYTVTKAAQDCRIEAPVNTTNWPAVGDEYQLPMKLQSPLTTGVLGDVSQFSGWPTGCTDLYFTPGGKPPYTLTIANAYIPPRNYTFDAEVFKWKIDFSRGYPFFVSVVDSTGLSYTAGPLHVGGGGSSSCLSKGAAGLSMTATAGVAVATLVIGALMALATVWAFDVWKKKHPTPLFSPVEEADFMPTPYSHLVRDTSVRSQGRMTRQPSQTSAYGRLPRAGEEDAAARSPPSTATASLSLGYMDPYNPRHSTMGSSADSKGSRPGFGGGGESDAEMEMGRRRSGAPGESQSLLGRNVFVVHHDGGGAPVTVFTDEGTEVVELPPSYLNARPIESSTSRQPAQRQSPSTSPEPISSLLPLPSHNSQAPSSASSASPPPADPFITPPGTLNMLPPLPFQLEGSRSSSSSSSRAHSPPATASHPSGPNRTVSRLTSSRIGGSRSLSGSWQAPRSASDASSNSARD